MLGHLIGKRIIKVPGAWMTDNPGRFIRHQQVLVFIEDPERILLCQPVRGSDPDLLQPAVTGRHIPLPGITAITAITGKRL